MKSPPTETGPSNREDDKNVEAKQPPATTKEKAQSETEKDSGYSDSSSESFSSEETPSTTSSETTTTSDTPQTQTAYTPIYILQNVVLKQPHVLLVQPPLRRHRKRPAPSAYLPILRSYPKIAPRVTPLSPKPDCPKDTDPLPPTSKTCKQTAPQLLDVSLRSLALLRRTRETQRSIRELKVHTRLYERALEGEEGGWERLRRAMERSGGYRKVPPATCLDRTDEAMDTDEASNSNTSDDNSAEEKPETKSEQNVTSPEKSMTSEAVPPDNDTGGAA
ncbi:CLOCK-interacting pacemaker-like [Dendropsophus ebraccatus]|uniref:CLOCK-interacting pacemaker-like n=1 Tax=Dendropsophus ebraccatus TaxID=150705 RepID=UPI00383205B6